MKFCALKSCHHAFDGGILRVGLNSRAEVRDKVGGSIGFEFAREGEGEGKGGVYVLSSRGE